MKLSSFQTHVLQQPFVFATGTAALIHSTWSLGTLFSGSEPSFGWSWVGWIIPALLIAFSLDVGQIVTAAEIRSGQRNWQKYTTFMVFALATYYLQWLYIAAHMPNVPLAPGISIGAQGAATTMRDAALWIIPALLPLSTLLYTFSQQHEPTPKIEQESNASMSLIPTIKADQVDQIEIISVDTDVLKNVPESPKLVCPDCGKEFEGQTARFKLIGHSGRCKERIKKMQAVQLEFTPNGNGDHHDNV